MFSKRLFHGFILIFAAGGALGRADSTLLADFEFQTAGNSLGGYFFFFDDRGDSGTSRITTADTLMYAWNSETFSAGAGGTQSALKLGFEFGKVAPKCGPGCSYAPMVGMGTHLMSGGAVNLTGARSVSFWAKADAPLQVSFSLGTSDITDNANFSTLLALGTEWKRYTIPLTSGPGGSLQQPSWGKEAAFDLSKAFSFGWGISQGDNDGMTKGAFYMDELVIDDWVYVDPTALRSRPASMAARPSEGRFDILGRMQHTHPERASPQRHPNGPTVRFARP